MKTKTILIRYVPVVEAEKFRKTAKKRGVLQGDLLAELVHTLE